jgi:transcription elongation factor/antiterminator RfaH
MFGNPFWVAVKTKSQKEQWAAENVANQGFESYLPLTVAPLKPTKRGIIPKPQCLFPRYLFVQTEGPWRFLLGTRGIMSVIMCGQRPAVMLPREIDELRARENAEGLIVLADKAQFRFNNGDKVRINEGVFSTYEGIYDRDPQNRVSVLLNMLGRRQPVPIDEQYLEAV